MRAGSCALVVVACLGSSGLFGSARADAVCVHLDRTRDNLTPEEQRGVELLVAGALAREGHAVAPPASCLSTAGVTVWAVRLGDGVTLTLTAGDRQVNGRAAHLGELDLLVSQLVRSLVTGRSLATGAGVTDRGNVLRDQAAPRRADAWDRRWDRVLAIGGGMLQLPAVDELPRQRQHDVIVLEARWWGMSGARTALELSSRIVLHDYAVLGDASDRFDRAQAEGDSTAELGRFLALAFSPLAVANYEVGAGLVRFAGARPPRPYLRFGATLALLNRFSDPEHYADLGLGLYAGVGVQLGEHLGLSVAAHVANPVVHNWRHDGYPYFLTTTASLEFRTEGRPPRPRFLAPSPPVIRRVDD